MGKKKIYSFDLYDSIMAELPPEIVDAMAAVGWNVFGIYELVVESIKKEDMTHGLVSGKITDNILNHFSKKRANKQGGVEPPIYL